MTTTTHNVTRETIPQLLCPAQTGGMQHKGMSSHAGLRWVRGHLLVLPPAHSLLARAAVAMGGASAHPSATVLQFEVRQGTLPAFKITNPQVM